jgi:hypothetical protein
MAEVSKHPYDFSLTFRDSPSAAAAVYSTVAVVASWALIAFVAPLVFRLPTTGISLKDGFSAFAVYYLAAQTIERVLEPFTGLFPTDDTVRTLYLWSVSTIIGMIVSAGLGLYFLTSILAAGSTIPLWADLGFTGFVIGGGSKALHDVISYINGQ